MIRFSKYLWLYAVISGMVLLPGMYSLVRFGLRQSIDFTGGTLLELRFAQAVSEQTIRSVAEKEEAPLVSIQRSDTQTYIIRLKPEGGSKIDALTKALAAVSEKPPEVIRDETVGPILGKELLVRAAFAAVLAILAILVYIAYAFKNIRFGISAIIALIHDLLVILGSFALLGYLLGVEVDTLFVTAFLTTMSFSVHDTIVVFDRIREYRRRDDKTPFDEVCDRALTETMNRSLTNSLTIVFMLIALVLMGGVTVRWFVVALTIGTISGAYSSPFVATPALILWDRWRKGRR